MNIEDVLREMRQRIEDEFAPGIENVKTWADTIETAMREKDEELDFLRSVKESRGRELDAKDAEIQRLTERVESAADGLLERDAEIEQWRTTSQNLLEQMLDETKQNQMLREALTWYEDKVRTAAWGVLHGDYGRTARAALAPEQS